MASPQTKNGYTPVANEICDEICQYAFNGAQLRLVIKIWRMTYGFSRKDHDFSITFLAANTLLSERTVKKELSFLIKANVLLVTKKATRTGSRRLKFNKNYEEWIIKKSGDSEMSSNTEVHDHAPNNDDDQVHDTSPHEVHDTSPNSLVLRGSIAPPDKSIKDLNQLYKTKEQMVEDFYSIYPRKIAKKKVESSWRTLCKDPDFNPFQAISYTANYIETCKLLGTKTKFIPYPATFLNQRRYEDYPTVDPEGLAASNNKFDSNLDFLKNQLGGGGAEQGTGNSALGEGNRGLPE